jgi:type II secretory ATPase GspE/PulE/Tfp pilus assembly ATPase PilB-like protein
MNSELVRVASPPAKAELASKVAALTLAKTSLSAAVKKPTKALGQMLIERGVLSEDQLRIALMEQKSLAMPLGKVLVTLGFLTEATLRDVLAEKLGQEQVDLSKVLPSANALALVPREFAKRNSLFPVSWDEEDGEFIIAMSKPNDVVVVDQLRAALPRSAKIQIRLAADSDIDNAIALHYGHVLSIDGILNEIETGEVDPTSLDISAQNYIGPFVRLVDMLLADSVQRRASDIHFEPEQGFLRIRYRIDGVMRQIRSLHIKYWPPMSVRLKILSGMNIAESRAPQDGRISVILNGRQIDFRAAALPTIYGENFVLRVLDRVRGLVPLENMGIDPAQLELLETMLARPDGVLLVTGPTGSGKTTTLYSILSKLNNEEVNIMTLEDPVEYPIPMIRQTNIASGIKMEFASGIRALMRQDPDIILVGEIRDQETATQAMRAAMTGHQVFSTLHTNSAVGAIPRLVDLGLTPDMLVGNLIGIIGQRLIRKLCNQCRTSFDIEPELGAMLGIAADAPMHLYRAAGCTHCDFRGFKGRIALLEILRFDEDLDDLIAKRAPTHDLLRLARKKGFRTLAHAAVQRVLNGETSLEEAARVVDLTNYGADNPDRITGTVDATV